MRVAAAKLDGKRLRILKNSNRIVEHSGRRRAGEAIGDDKSGQKCLLCRRLIKIQTYRLALLTFNALQTRKNSSSRQAQVIVSQQLFRRCVRRCAWRDSQVAQFMSNWHDPREESNVLRRESGYSGRRSISAPKLASDYNAYMGGVDQLDSLRGSCTCALKSKKWWHSLLWWMLDSSMVNAYKVYKFEEEQARRRPLARVDFIFACVNELIKDEHLPADESRMSTGQRRRARPEAGTECPSLHPVSLDGDRTNCKNCWNRNGLRQTTKWRCVSTHVHFYLTKIFDSFHKT